MSQVREVKEAINIVEVIGQRLTLLRAGSYYKGNCPFHSEKSPSFFVDETLQRYKCFGCGESGDVFNFLEKYDGMTFGEALEELADQAGITLQAYTKDSQDLLREQLLEVLDLAKQYYHYLLTTHEQGDVAREYLHERKITQESIKVFQMGYALEQWDGLIKYLHVKKKYPLDILEQAGLITQGQYGKWYDRFRGRIIFPLTDHRGRVVGFSGRKIAGDEKDAKYINSPETILYHKSQMLFGFSELYQEIRKAKQVVVVEGEFDVISSTQAHMNAIVAIKGSALTKEHAKLLKRTVDKVLLSLDTDSAGVAATKKAIEALSETEVELRVVIIPDGKDPDELIKADPKAWRECVKESIPAHEFLIRVALKTNDKTKPEGKRAIMKELLPMLCLIEHAVEQEYYTKYLAEQLEVKPEIIKEDITSYKNKLRTGLTQKELKSKADDKNKQVQEEHIRKETARSKLERYALFLLFQINESQVLQLAKELTDVVFSNGSHTQIIRSLLKWNTTFNLRQFANSLPEDLQQELFSVCSHQDFLKNKDTIDLGAEFTGVVKKLKAHSISEQVLEITKELSRLDEKEEKTPEEIELQNQLLKRIVELRKST